MKDTELENGYNLTFENSKKLIEEAKILVVFERYSRAYTLYQIAIEEIGKCHILHKAILDYYMGTKIDNDYLKDLGFCDHVKKTKHSLVTELLAIQMYEESIGQGTVLTQELIKDYNNVKDLNIRKNRSLYVDFSNNKFLTPEIEITKEMVEDISIKAQVRRKATELILQPLDEMKKKALELKAILNDPIRRQAMEDKIDLLYK